MNSEGAALSHLLASLPDFFRDIAELTARVADRNGVRAALVGGVVRDWMLGRRVQDADIMIEHPAHDTVKAVAAERRGDLVAHPRFGTFTIAFGERGKIDFVTARTEIYPKPGGLPVVEPARMEDDLRRRDFTLNAIACLLNGAAPGAVLDPFGGRADMAARILRVLHEKSFLDDPTRICRAARFAARLDFQVEPGTLGLLGAALDGGALAALSPVRRRNEFFLVMKEAAPLAALSLMEKWGALAQLDKAWRVRPEHTVATLFDAGASLPSRLAWWLRPWGKDEATRMMGDLGFEKATKRDVLAAL